MRSDSFDFDFVVQQVAAYNNLIGNLTDFSTEVELINLNITTKVDYCVSTLTGLESTEIESNDTNSTNLNETIYETESECYITPLTDEELAQNEIDRVAACMADYYDACDLTMRNAESQEMAQFEGNITNLIENLEVSDGCYAIETELNSILE